MSLPTQDLSGQVIRGGAWVFSLRIANRGLMFARTFILARLILPGDFGLIGIALLAASVLETFSETGFRTALIQRERTPDEYWDTAFWISAGRGLLLGGLLFGAAPWVAGFFKAPESVNLIRLIALSPVLNGLSNPSVVRYQREMAFHRQFVYEIGMNLVNTGLAVALGVIYRSAWALAVGVIAGQGAGLVISWSYHAHRVRPRLSRQAARDLFGFGRWLSGSSIINFLLLQGDDILVGRVLGAGPLGLYQMAYRISHAPMTEVAQVVSSVTLPAFARMSQDLERMRRSYLRVLGATTMLSFPLGILIIILGPDFTRTVLGDQWMPMAPALQVMGVYGMVHSIGGTIGPVFMGMGKPDLAMKLLLIKLGIMAALIFPLLTMLHLVGAAVAVTLATLIMNPITDYFLVRLLELPVSQFLKALVPGLGCAAGAGLPALAAVVTLSNAWLRLGLGAAGALSGLALAVIIINRINPRNPSGEIIRLFFPGGKASDE